MAWHDGDILHGTDFDWVDYTPTVTGFTTGNGTVGHAAGDG